MKKFLVLFLTAFSLVACGEKEDSEPKNEKIKLFVIADPGIYSTNSPVALQLSGTGIQTTSNITSVNVSELEFTKGESHTLTLKATQGDPMMSLEVARTPSLKLSDRIAFKEGRGTISVTFVAQ
jgi:molybdopterin-binding protein